MNFKIDTGSECSIIIASRHRKIGDPPMLKSKRQLISYSGLAPQGSLYTDHSGESEMEQQEALGVLG